MSETQPRIFLLFFFGALTTVTIASSIACGQGSERGSAEQGAASAEKPPIGAKQPALPAAPAIANPFQRQIAIPDLPSDLTWFNTTEARQLQDFKGKFVLIDFWTYCCINCIHILPELKKLEQAFSRQLVVVGVHSAKFDTERADDNLREAILRYEIEHPVVNDPQLEVWRTFGANSWPTILLIDPNGKAVFMRSGEFQFEQMQAVLNAAIPYYRQQGSLDETPLRFDQLSKKQPKRTLSFPGKVLANEKTQQLFIADSNHNRIIVTDLEGRSPLIIGSGKQGRTDGDFGQAEFHHPQGLAFDGEQNLYVADTENHLIRHVDLTQKTVRTIAGMGIQGRNAWPGWTGDPNQKPESGRWVGAPLETALNSPWALWIHDHHLMIAMAGSHQLWRMPLKGDTIGPYAGNGREDIVDGPRLPVTPYGLNASSFAQPSGLASDGRRLFVADSEGSAIRVLPFDPTRPVSTLIGPSQLPANRLFEFGDIDGKLSSGKLQHAIGIAYGDQKLFVADTYNNKVKVIDLSEATISTLTNPADNDQPFLFNEPAGLSFAAGKLYVADTNNHRIRVLNLLEPSQIQDLKISGLSPPTVADLPQPPADWGTRIPLPDLTVGTGELKLQIQLPLAPTAKVNQDFPIDLVVSLSSADELSLQTKGTPQLVDPKLIEVAIGVKGVGSAKLKVDLTYGYCEQQGDRLGVCKLARLIGHGKLHSQAGSSQSVLRLDFAPPASD
ncbi:MAG: thioredoxin-like domain-containing protein [Pirellulaceae bacterium]|nr:thioredoxin-like domain-containing protein [Pirellulaceae bacterium]